MAELTFRTFAADPANEFGLRLSEAVANLDTSYSPVVLHGELGAGKSHLLTAIATDLRRRHPDVPFLYLSEEAPVEYLLSRPSGEDIPDQGYMYHPYADQRVLLVDDMERFAVNGLRERFELLFDAFFDTQRLMILACRQSPHALAGFDARFLSRLNGGVAAELGLPTSETRVRILKLEAERIGFRADTKALTLLAELPVKSVGQLVDLLRQVRQYCVVTGQAPSAATIAPLLGDVAAACAAGSPVAAEQWCAQWYERQVAHLKSASVEELRQAREHVAMLEASLAEQTSGTSAVKAKIKKAAEAVKARDAELQALRGEVEKLRTQLTAELPHLQELLADKDARLQEVQDQAAKDVQQYQTRLAEAVSSAEAALQGAQAQEATAAAHHAEEVAALEGRLEEIYAALNDAQQDFAIQNQNKDKLLEKLSDDYQSLKRQTDVRASELAAAQGRIAELEGTVTDAEAQHAARARAEAELAAALERQAAEFEAARETAQAEFERRIAALRRDHEQALATAGDEGAMENAELRRKLDAQEGAVRQITAQVQEKIGALERETKLHQRTREALDQLQAASAEHADLSTNLRRELAAAEERQAELERRIQDGEATAEAAAAELEARHAALSAATAARETAEAQAAELREQVAARAEEATALRAQLERSAAAVREAEEAAAARQREMDALQEQVQAAEAARTAVREDADAANAHFDEQRRAYEAAAAKRDAVLAETTKLLEKARKDAATAEQTLAGREAQLRAEQTGLRDTLAAREAELKDLQELQRAQDQQFDMLHQRMATSEAEALELRKRLMDRDALAEAVRAERARTRELEALLNDAEGQAQSSRKELEARQKDTEAVHADLRTRLTAAETATATAEKNLRTQAAALAEAREAVETTRQELSAVRDARANDAREAEEALHTRTTAVERLTTRVEQLASDLAARDTALQEHAQRLHHLQQQLAQKEALIAEVREDDSRVVEQMKAELREREEEMTALRARVEQLGEAHEADLRAAAAQTEAERAHAAEVTAALDAAGAARRELEAKLAEAASALELANQRHAMALASASGATEQLTQKLAAMEAAAGVREAEVARLHERVAEAEAVATERQQTLTTLSERVRALERDITTAQEAKEEATTALADYRAAHEAAAEQTEKALTAAREEREARMAAVQQSLDALNAERNSLATKLNDSRAAFAAIEAQLATAQRQVDNLRADLAAREARATELEDLLTQRELAATQAAADREDDSQGVREEQLIALREQLAGTAARLETAERGAQTREQEARELREAQEALAGDLERARLRESDLEAQLNAATAAADRARADTAAQQAAIEAREAAHTELEQTIAALREELAEARTGLTPEAEAHLAEQTTRVEALERELAELRERGPDPEAAAQILELQTQVEARERTLESLQESFTTQIAESSAKAREREATLTTTVRDLQSQLNQIQVVSDDSQAETAALTREVETLRAQLQRTQADLAQARQLQQAAEAAAQRAGTPPAAPLAAPLPGTGAPPALQPSLTPLETPMPVPAVPLVELALEPTAPLNPRQTLDTFETAPTSEFSMRSAIQVTRTPGELYNPFVVYGQKNAGKTHILHGMGNAIAAANAEFEVVYVRIPEVMAVLAQLEADADLDAVSLAPDVLLLDDFEIEDLSAIQQLRLAKVLSNFVQDGRQLVLASPVPPVKMTGIERELMRFLEAGLLVKFDVNEDALAREVDAMAVAIDDAIGEAPDAGAAAPPIEAVAASEPEPQPWPPIEPHTTEQTQPAPLLRQPPRGGDVFANVLQVNPELLRVHYRGQKVFDDFLEAYRAPNSSRRTRFPLIVAEEDVRKRHHFFHALGNELQAMFPTASIAILSFASLAGEMRLNADFDPRALVDRLIATDLILLNDGEALADAPADVVRAATAIVSGVLDAQKLIILGLRKADRRHKVFGEAVRAGTKKKI